MIGCILAVSGALRAKPNCQEDVCKTLGGTQIRKEDIFFPALVQTNECNSREIERE